MGMVEVYDFNSSGNKLERTEGLCLHDEDVARVKNFDRFERVIIDKEVMIAQRRLFYFHKSKDDIVPGVL